MNDMDAKRKYMSLQGILEEMGRVVVAYSGGGYVDAEVIREVSHV